MLEPEEVYGLLLREHNRTLAEVREMTDYQILHVLGNQPSPAALEHTRRRRDSCPPPSADPREDFANLLSAGGRCTREQALAEYDRQFGTNGKG